MKQLYKLVAVLAALCVASAALALGAAAAQPAGARLDPHYGRAGGFTVPTPKNEALTVQPPAHLAVAPSNRAYVQQGSWVVAFGANGKPDTRFGNYGRMVVTPHTGQLAAVTGVAVDSQNRVLVAGSLEPVPGLLPKAIKGDGETTVTQPHPVTEAFVMRYLPDGSLDTSFGNGGEVDTTLGAPRTMGSLSHPAEYERPSVRAVHLAVDAEDRPVIEGKFVQRIETCFYKSEVNQAIVARLNVDGSLDTSFGTNGLATIASETPIALAAAPDGAWATLSGPEVCEHGVNGQPTQLSGLTESGAALSTLDPARPTLRAAEEVLAVDAQGRVYFTERGEAEPGPARVVRLLANGDLDSSYGNGGAIGLKGLGAATVGALAVDAKGRMVAGFGTRQFELARITSAGKIDHGFAKHGTVAGKLGASSRLQALAFDSQGRIVAAGLAEGSGVKGGNGISIARFLPGS
jgi:uncharacterized delta-60 repeat protein